MVFAYSDIHYVVTSVKESGPDGDEVLEKTTIFNPNTLSHYSKSREAIQDQLDTIVGYSLTEFLLNNDRRKLKKCPYCQIYFIAKDTKRKLCYSNECKKRYQREEKRKQRERDPLTYY